MSQLPDEQIETIRERLAEGGVRTELLMEDLLDHVCCVVEAEMRRGASFETALAFAILEIAPNGLRYVEHQTRFLLNSTKIIIMKKLMYFIGFIGAAALSTGMVFKLLYWPMANVLSITGLISLLLIFIPLWALERYKVQISKAMSVKFRFIAGVTSAVICGLSVIFKLLHLQGASILLVVGSFIFVFAFLPFLFFSLYKESIS